MDRPSWRGHGGCARPCPSHPAKKSHLLTPPSPLFRHWGSGLEVSSRSFSHSGHRKSLELIGFFLAKMENLWSVQRGRRKKPHN